MEKKDKTRWSSFGKLKTAEELDLYLTEREHDEYYHYTGLEAIGAILDSSSLRLSSPNRLNDNIEKENMDKANLRNRVYIGCFSSGVHENLSLWCIYAGRNLNGGRIRFTKGGMKNICNTPHVIIKQGETARTLDRKKDFEVLFRDVVYIDKNSSGNCGMKYNNLTNFTCFPMHEYEKYVEKNPLFVKNIIWYYEKETRIVVKVSEEIAKEFVNTDDKPVYVHIPLDEKIRQAMSIQCAPGIKTMEEIESKQYIRDFIHSSSKVSLSGYCNEININFCGNCNKNSFERNESK